MNRKSILAASVSAMTMVLIGCGITVNNNSNTGTDILGDVLNSMNTKSIGNALGSVLGIDKPTERELIGTWHYNGPGVAFTSSNTLAKAGGEVAASQAKVKLEEAYRSVGFNRNNTQLTFNSDKTFSGKIAGTSLMGTWSYDNSNQKITLKTLLFTIPVYAKRATSGMSFLLESKKLLSVLQTVSALSGNSTLQTVGELSRNYDGIRMGFEMRR